MTLTAELVEYAKEQGRLGKLQEDGHSLREHLQAAGQLQEPEMPDCGRYLWEWFAELHSGRGAGMAGPEPITWRDIAAWAELTGTRLMPWEVRAIRAIDNGFLSQ